MPLTKESLSKVAPMAIDFAYPSKPAIASPVLSQSSTSPNKLLEECKDRLPEEIHSKLMIAFKRKD
jgi:hypothetical protein